MNERLGILHPGAMGASVAAALQRGGHSVAWASAGRSPQTRARAARLTLHDAGSLAALCAQAGTLLSVCPPHAAEALAGEVIACGFRGRYLDANAIAPARARRIAAAMAAAGIEFVDGGILGGPAWEAGTTRLYLAGPQAAALAALFAGGPLEAVVLSAEIGQASALKMCYAAYNKGRTALLAAVLAAAEALDVEQALAAEWSHDDADLPETARTRTRRVTARAWRFAGEMEEIAATLAEVGLPPGFHQAAAELYRRLADYKDRADPPPLPEVLAALRARGEAPRSG
jgi:3-hydroxyisobutyrate dehydrogenase-like beta-hydroxyacid dehydrogenase